MGEPGRGREMVQGDHRPHAGRTQLGQHLPVVVDLRRVELAGGRLDARPLDREPVRTVPQPVQELEVLPKAMVLVAGRVGAVAVQDAAALLELPPVAVVVAALDLVGGGGAAPEEPVGEAPLHAPSLSPQEEGGVAGGAAGGAAGRWPSGAARPGGAT